MKFHFKGIEVIDQVLSVAANYEKRQISEFLSSDLEICVAELSRAEVP